MDTVLDAMPEAPEVVTDTQPGESPAASTPEMTASAPSADEFTLDLADLGVTKPTAPIEVSDDDLAKAPEKDVREWAKGWKATAAEAREAQSLIQGFGGIEDAREVKEIVDAFSGPTFDAQAFLGKLSKVDSGRVAQLLTFAGSKGGAPDINALLSEKLGGPVDDGLLQNFREYRASGGKMIHVPGSEPIPERFLYTSGIDPETGEEVKRFRTPEELDSNPDFQLWKEAQAIIKQGREREENQRKEQEQLRLQADRQARADFAVEKKALWYSPVDRGLEKFGYAPDKSDTPQVRREKQVVAAMIEGAVDAAFSDIPENKELSDGAFEYINRAELDRAKGYFKQFDIDNRIQGIVADTVMTVINMLNRGVKPRAAAVATALAKEQQPRPTVTGGNQAGPPQLKDPDWSKPVEVAAWMNARMSGALVEARQR